MNKFKILALVTLIGVFTTGIQSSALGTTSTTSTTSTSQQTSAVELGTKTTSDGLFRYNVVDAFTYKYVVITQYIGKSQVVNIPSTIEGFTVERIGNNAFNSNTTIKSVKIPQIKKIGSGVFYGCTSLEEVTIAENIVDIGVDAFKNCPIKKITVSRFGIYASEQVSLTTVTDWLKTVNRMNGLNISNVQGKYYSYRDTYIKNLLTDYTYTIVNNEVTIVRYNGTATTLVVPETMDGKPVTKIGPEAFYADRNLVDIKLPANVQTADKNILRDCTSLENLTVSIETTTVDGTPLLNTSIENLTIETNDADTHQYTDVEVEQLLTNNYNLGDILVNNIVIVNNDGAVLYTGTNHEN